MRKRIGRLWAILLVISLVCSFLTCAVHSGHHGGDSCLLCEALEGGRHMAVACAVLLSGLIIRAALRTESGEGAAPSAIASPVLNHVRMND